MNISSNIKFNVLFQGPVMNRSGYGVASDLIAHALLKYPRFALLTVPLNWGNCITRQTVGPWDNEIKATFSRSKGPIPQPHIELQCTMPGIQAPQGSIYNITMNAGVETNKAPDHFLKGINGFDLTIVPSNHTKQTYLNSDIKPTKPIEILPWSVNTDIYKIDALADDKIDAVMNNVSESQCFLFTGQITNGNASLDRKDILNLVKTFCETFKGKDNKPALILKTSGTSYSYIDRNQIIEMIKNEKDKIASDVNVYVLHGELSETQMASLNSHKKIIAHISFTHGEGFGLPLLEFSLSGKPIIVSNWSGHLDFLEDKFIPLEGSVDVISKQLESEYFPSGSSWFNVDTQKATKTLLDFYYGDRTESNKLAMILAKENAKKYTVDRFVSRLHNILDKHLLGVN